MLNLPGSTIVNRVIAKEKFYSKTDVNTKLRQLFIDEIEKIQWVHKLSPQTLNITSGAYDELQVFEITLKGSDISPALLRHIDTFIPSPILFIIIKPGAVKAALSYKEPADGKEERMRIEATYQTPWTQVVEFALKGRSVDEVYRNYLYQIAPELHSNEVRGVKEAIELNAERQKIVKQVDALKKRISNELSLAKKQELALERHALEQSITPEHTA